MGLCNALTGYVNAPLLVACRDYSALAPSQSTRLDKECQDARRFYNQSEAGTERWQRTGRKNDLLWLYWMNRAMQVFVDSGLAEQIIGSPENHELNQLAYIKAMRSELQLQQIYGLGDRLALSDGAQVRRYLH